MKNIPVKMYNVLASKRALVDDEDFERVNALKWRESDKGYVVRTMHTPMIGGKRKTTITSMHRFVMGAEGSSEVDHINGNPLDNRKSNLRFCSHQENLMNKRNLLPNKAGLQGVSYRHDLKKPWGAKIGLHGRTILIGYFSTKEAAHEAYKAASLKYFREFSPFFSGESLQSGL
jgi:hypothetical protein